MLNFSIVSHSVSGFAALRNSQFDSSLVKSIQCCVNVFNDFHKMATFINCNDML